MVSPAFSCVKIKIDIFTGFTRTGLGELAEKIYREVPGARIPGGSEDVLLDLAVRQLVKNYKAKTNELQVAGAGYMAKL